MRVATSSLILALTFVAASVAYAGGVNNKPKVSTAEKKMNSMSTRSRNEADKIKGNFTVKRKTSDGANGKKPQSGSVLRNMKDLRRVGVGGTGLGSN